MITTFSNKRKGLCKLSLLASLLTNLVWVGEGLGESPIIEGG